MCRIIYEKIVGNEKKEVIGTGFFCEIDNFPIKYVLFTNNHILNENNIEIINTINIEYYEDLQYKTKKIEISETKITQVNP